MKKALIDLKGSLSRVKKIIDLEPDPSFARRARIIFKNMNLSGKEKILEVGCGRGFYLKTLIDVLSDLDITGIDLNKKYLSVAKKFIDNKKVKLINADATNLPFKNETFDRIIATEILEHIPDDQKAISEMFRVLKPGGIAMITVPNKNYPFFWDPLNWTLERLFHWHIPANIWWLAGLWADHVRLYDEKELGEKIKKSGFKVQKVWYATHYCLPFSHFLLYGIGKNLVEKGLCQSFNRFDRNQKQSLLNKLLLWPIRVVDGFNERDNYKSCVNLVFKIQKNV